MTKHERPTSGWMVAAAAAVVLLAAGIRTGSAEEASGGGAPSAPVLLDAVAAVVNARVIIVGDVIEAMGGEQQRLLRTHSGDELSRLLNEAFDAAREDLVARALVIDAFGKDGAQIPDWAVEREVQQTMHDRFNNSRSRLEQALRNDGLTLDDMRHRIREKMIFQAMRSSKVSQNIRVTAFDVYNHYAANPQAFATAAEVRVRVLVLTGPGSEPSDERRERANALRRRVTEGEDFEALSRQFSDEERKESGGDWGWLNPKQLRPELAEAIEKLAPGGVSDVIDVGGDCYIVKLEERRGSTVRPFAEVESLIERQLREAQARRIFDAWIAELREQAYVLIADIKLF